MFASHSLLLLLLAIGSVLQTIKGVHQPAPYIQGTSTPPTLPPTPRADPDCPPSVRPLPRHVRVEHNTGVVNPSHNLPLPGETDYDGRKGPSYNCSTGPGVHVKRGHDNLWKTHVIIACTVTAAIEVVIVIVIVLYWRQLRWSFRKLTCPCDERPHRGQHEAIDSSDSETDAEEDGAEVSDLEAGDRRVQTFPGPSTSSGISADRQLETSQV